MIFIITLAKNYNIDDVKITNTNSDNNDDYIIEKITNSGYVNTNSNCTDGINQTLVIVIITLLLTS